MKPSEDRGLFHVRIRLLAALPIMLLAVYAARHAVLLPLDAPALGSVQATSIAPLLPNLAVQSCFLLLKPRCFGGRKGSVRNALPNALLLPVLAGADGPRHWRLHLVIVLLARNALRHLVLLMLDSSFLPVRKPVFSHAIDLLVEHSFLLLELERFLGRQ